MKLHLKPMLILLALCLLSCSAPETSEQVLRRLMEVKMKDGKFDTSAPGILTRVPSSIDGVDYWLEGRYRMRNELLIITILDNVDANQQYYTGVFKENDNGWKSLFETDLIPGRLDTLVDLNHDGIDEFILDEYQSNSAGFESFQFLYAKKDKLFLEKIDTLSRRYNGNSGTNLTSSISYEPGDTETVLTVSMRELDYMGKESLQVLFYRWQPPNLVKEVGLSGQNDLAEFTDPLTEDLAVAGLLAKWFPLTESDGKLKRQQLCGAEGFIEIMANDQHTWHEQGYQDVSEASVDAVMPKGEGGYLITIKLADGSKKEIKFERNLEVDFVYTIDGRSYTNQPDKFEVVNDTQECGN